MKIKNVKETRKSKQIVHIRMLVSVGDSVPGAFYVSDLKVKEEKFVKVDSVGHADAANKNRTRGYFCVQFNSTSSIMNWI